MEPALDGRNRVRSAGLRPGGFLQHSRSKLPGQRLALLVVAEAAQATKISDDTDKHQLEFNECF